MWKLKSCPRCGGDMFLEKGDKWYEHCLQCGYARELKRLAGSHNREGSWFIMEVKDVKPGIER